MINTVAEEAVVAKVAGEVSVSLALSRSVMERRRNLPRHLRHLRHHGLPRHRLHVTREFWERTPLESMMRS
jgi:hypothetical protein